MRQVEPEPSGTQPGISKLAIAGFVVLPAYMALVFLGRGLIGYWFPNFLVSLMWFGIFGAPIVGMMVSIAALVIIRRAGGSMWGEKLARLGRDLNISILVLLALFFVVLPSIS